MALPRPEEAPVIRTTFSHVNKKGQAIYITPLQPPTLAAFPPWGDSAGAGCAGLAQSKDNRFRSFDNYFKFLILMTIYTTVK